MEEISLTKLKSLLVKQYKLGHYSEHGISHWERVEKLGKYLLRFYKSADPKIITIFAYLHDSQKKTEADEPLHGPRAAEFAKKLYEKKLLPISKSQLNQLVFACYNHSNPKVKSNNITIKICWDSDRLDFWRVGEIPNPKYLNTAVAKQKETIEYALKLTYAYFRKHLFLDSKSVKIKQLKELEKKYQNKRSD